MWVKKGIVIVKLFLLVFMKSCLVMEVGSMWCFLKGRIKVCKRLDIFRVCNNILFGNNFFWLFVSKKRNGLLRFIFKKELFEVGFF